MLRMLPLSCLLALSAAAAEPDALESQIRPINEQLLRLLSVKAAPRAAAAPSSQLSALIAERAVALGRLIELDPRRALALALPAAARHRLAAAAPGSAARIEQRGAWSGPLTELIADDMRAGRSRRLLWMRAGGANLQLYFVHEPGRLKTGDLATVQGLRLGDRVAVASARRYLAAATPPDCTLTGEQPVAAILVSFPGQPAPQLTTEQVRQSLFGDPGPSLDGYWRDASYGKTSARGDVFGWFQLDRAYGCNETNALANAAIQAAWAHVDLTPYTRNFIYYPEPEGGCGWSAMGTVGCIAGLQASVVWMPVADWWTPDRMVQLAIHEGGHSLTLQHSDSRDYGPRPLGAPSDPGARTEYGDPISAMGNYPYFGHYTAEQKLSIGWLTPTQVATVEDGGTFHLTPLGSPGEGLKALQVRRTTNPDAWFWLEYRQPIGIYESTLPEQVFTGALIHYRDQVNGYGEWAGHTDLLDFTPQSGDYYDFEDAALAAGKSWVDPWTPRGIEVTAADSNGLTVNLTNDACVTLSALSRDHGPGAETGSITVTAPAGCNWTVAASVPWIHVTSPASGAGNGLVTYSLDENTETAARTGTLAIGRKPVLITQAPVNQPPALSYLDPTSGSGPALDLFAMFDDPNGADDLRLLRVNVSTSPALAGGCALEFDLAADTVRIADDSGAWRTPVASTLISTLSNSQCRVVDGWAYYGILEVILVFNGPTGDRKIFLSAQDAGGLDSGWQQAGSWSVTENHPPQALLVAPGAGAGYAQTFTFAFSDPDGPLDLQEVIASLNGPAGQCPLRVWPGAWQVELGSNWDYLASSGTLENNYCAIDLAQSWIFDSGDETRVVLALTFKPAFAGAANWVLQALDLSGATSPVLNAGQWTVGELPGAKPAINDGGTVNAASFAGGPVAPGEIVTIFGTGLGPADLALAQYSAGYLENSAGDCRVFFDGIQAPMVYSQDRQVSAIVPYEVSGATRMTIHYQGRISNEVTLTVAAAAPGIFKYTPRSQGVIVNAEDNNTFNSADIPAERGKIVTFFATGEGPTSPRGDNGWLPLQYHWPEPLGDVVVTFGGVPGEVLFKGLTYAGVLQINVRVPADAPTGPAVPLVLSVAGISDPQDTTIALR